MTLKTAFFIAAAIVALPALILIANICVYAFVGAGFLPVATDDVTVARGAVLSASAAGSTFIFGLGNDK